MRLCLAILLLVAAVATAYCGDIVTVPTANQLKKGEVDAAVYYLGFDLPSAAPQYLVAQTLYLGLTDKLELDVHRYDPEKSKDITSTIVNATYLLVKESAKLPNVVVGGRNLGAEKTTNAPVESTKRSWHISAAKNITPMTPQGPKLPLIRLHLSYGTADYTLLGKKRHEGPFGGVQALLTPQVGAVALADGHDLITGLTYTLKKMPLTVKGGTYGKHWWVGTSYAMKI